MPDMSNLNLGNVVDVFNRGLAAVAAGDIDLNKIIMESKQEANDKSFIQEMEKEEPPGSAVKLQKQSKNIQSFAKGTSKLQKGEKVIQAVARTPEQKDKSAQNFQQRNPEMKADKLMNLLSKMKGKMSSSEIMDHLQKEFKDPHLIHEAMNFLLENTVDDPELHQSVKDTQDAFFESNKKEITAGVNIGDIARKYARTTDKAPELRSLYNDITGSPREAKDLFNELTAKYPTYKDLTHVIKFLFSAVGEELSIAKLNDPARPASIEKGQLLNLVNESKTLQAIVGIYRCFKERMPLIEKLFADHGEPVPQRINFQSMAKDFIAFLGDRYPTSDKMVSSMDKLGVHSISGKIIVIEANRDATHNISPRLYNSPQHRDEVRGAILEALEKLYQDEEYEEDKTALEASRGYLKQPDTESVKPGQVQKQDKVQNFPNLSSKGESAA